MVDITNLDFNGATLDSRQVKPGMLFDITQDMRVSYEHTMLVRPGDEIELVHEN